MLPAEGAGTWKVNNMIVTVNEFLKYKELKGVFANGCVKRGEGSRFHAKAHAHTDESDSHKGWICVLSEKRLSSRELMLHELSHILTNNGHTDKWRAKLLELGGTLDIVYEANGKGILLQSYHKKKRLVNAK